MHTWWTNPVDEICKQLATDSKQGLTHEEAHKRLIESGPNRLPEQKPISPLTIFFNQFFNLIVCILIGASFVSGLLGEWADALAIIIIVFINGCIGFFQEYKAEQALVALRAFVQPTSRVIRQGILKTLSSYDLVPGDLVVLESGDRIPADGRIVYAAQFATQEAALTGESIPLYKSTDTLSEASLPIGDRKNMVFMGTIVVGGKATVIITETGQKTELGKISALLQAATEPPTPLQIKLDTLGRSLLVKCLIAIAIIFMAGLLRGYHMLASVITAISLAVAAIPEGLPAITTVALALGVRRMAKRNALIRHLTSVETLGCTTVVCTDKTGTLTKNEMTARSLWVNGDYIDITGTGYAPQGEFKHNGSPVNAKEHAELALALKIGTLCSSASLYETDDGWAISGDPTEGALLTAASKAGVTKQQFAEKEPFVAELPFDATRKRMSVIHNAGNKNIVYVKGGSDVILRLSTNILINGQIIPVTDEYKARIEQAIETLSSKALRVLALAYRYSALSDPIDTNLEANLTFVGLIGMIDSPRPEAYEAILKCKNAGIRVIMITGDHKATAIAIAQELDVMEEHTKAVDGIELERMSDDELANTIQSIAVYARVSAEQKIRIIKAWKKHGDIVAMTGDGVNDAPALKAADIGIAMGFRGTDVAKEASDMIITDDNFASIVSAIEEGRGIYDNIIKFIHYLFSANTAELLSIFLANILGFRDPSGTPFVCLMPIQLLWLNLITDGLPALALSVDPLDPTVMSQPPRSPQEAILPRRSFFELNMYGLIIAIGTIIACHQGLKTSATLANTMSLTTFIVLEFVRLYLIRSKYHINFFSNKWLSLSLAGSLILHLIVLYTPFLQQVFGLTALTFNHWLMIIGISTLVAMLSLAFQLLMKRTKS